MAAAASAGGLDMPCWRPTISFRHLHLWLPPLRSVIFCEAVAIYGVIVAIILQTHLEQVITSTEVTAMMKYAGYGIFWSGMTAGLGNLSCG